MRSTANLTKKELIDRVLRVDLAGEYGARRIYEGANEEIDLLFFSPSIVIIFLFCLRTTCCSRSWICRGD